MVSRHIIAKCCSTPSTLAFLCCDFCAARTYRMIKVTPGGRIRRLCSVEGHHYYVFVAPGRALPRPIVYLVIPPTGHLFLQITLSIAFFKKLILIPQSPSCLLFIDLTVIPALSLRQFLPSSGEIQGKAATNSLLPHSRP